MISFRCWYCNKKYAVAEARVGQEIGCTCNNRLRVPARSDGNCRIKTLTDRVVETVVYGGGGALLGLGLAILILSQIRGTVVFADLPFAWLLVAGLTVVGFLFGFLLGERGMEVIGRAIRDRESR